MDRKPGFREIEHTADWELHVWASDLFTLLRTSARGMYALSLTESTVGPLKICEFEISFKDRESLLVDFLSELLFLGEVEGLAFDSFQFKFDSKTFKVQASGTAIKKQAKEIKAVTYHDLKIQDSDRGLEVNIVFDV